MGGREEEGGSVAKVGGTGISQGGVKCRKWEEGKRGRKCRKWEKME